MPLAYTIIKQIKHKHIRNVIEIHLNGNQKYIHIIIKLSCHYLTSISWQITLSLYQSIHMINKIHCDTKST